MTTLPDLCDHDDTPDSLSDDDLIGHHHANLQKHKQRKEDHIAVSAKFPRESYRKGSRRLMIARGRTKSRAFVCNFCCEADISTQEILDAIVGKT
jgi:hypothetical protein